MTEAETPGPRREMNEMERAIAEEAYAAMNHASDFSERGQQAHEFRVGISDLGYCSERTRRMLSRMERDVPEDHLAAFLGTAIGDHMEQALHAYWDDVILKAEVSVTLTGDRGTTYTIYGHPDVVRTRGIVLDVKTARGTQIARRRGGPDAQQQIQRHLYARGAWDAGLFGDLPLEEVMVGNLWVDRAGDEKEFYVQVEPYDPQVMDDAALWLDEVVYAYLNEEEAPKEPPRQVCAVTCGYFPSCRSSDVEGLITDDDKIIAFGLYREGAEMLRMGKRLQDQAKAELQGIQGSFGGHTLRWVHVNGSHIEFDRPSYDRIVIEERK